MNRVEILRQSPLEKKKDGNTFEIFGKEFVLDRLCENHRIIIHEDFPLINENDINDFVSYSLKKGAIVISGGKAKVHPYRLMVIDEAGYDGHLFDVPREIRGNRHLYPEVFQFVPALISIPPNTSINGFRSPKYIDMYIMAPEKLLNKSCLLDRLWINSIGRRGKVCAK
jgi:hypothetical protein